MIKKTRKILSNGLAVVIIEIPDSKSLVTSFWTKAGARFDPAGKAGVAHFMEHLLIKKTKSYPTDIKLAQKLEKVGAFKNGSTSKDFMELNISSSSKDLELTTHILSEMVFNPYIDKKGFEAERKVILQEKARKDSTPDDLVWEVFAKAFYAGSPLTNSVLGEKKSLENISLNDVKNYWENISTRNSNMLLISGGIDTDRALKLAEKYFGKKKLRKDDTVPTFEYKVEKRIQVEKRILPRANMFFAFRIPGGKRYEEVYALLVLRGILALGWSSRIYQRLRVKESLVYGIGSRVARYFDSGVFSFMLASDKKNFPKMISVLCEEIVKIRENGISKEELDLTIGFISGVMLSSVETSSAYEDWYAIDELYWPDSVESVEERVGKIQKVKKEDVELVARKYLTKDNWYLGVVGDVKEKDLEINL
jgi:predicted Zn-dependent peptidase